MIDKPTHEQVKQNLDKALALLLTHDSYLLEMNVNERSITHRLAIYLERLFDGWNVDCEYNRVHSGEGKKLETLVKYLKGKVPGGDGSVFPDIVIHHRDKRENLFVIEVSKTAQSPKKKEHDREKLKGYKCDLGYAYGCFSGDLYWQELSNQNIHD